MNKDMTKDQFADEVEKWWNENDKIIEQGANIQHLVERVEALENFIEELLHE